MKISHFGPHARVAVAALVLAGCAGSRSGMPQVNGNLSSASSWQEPARVVQLSPANGWDDDLLVSTPDAVEVISSRTWRKVGSIPVSGPKGGSWVDLNGNLYIAARKSNAVLEFAPNTTKPKYTYSGMHAPVIDVTTDRSLNVWVANWTGFSEFAQGSNAVTWACQGGSSGFGAVMGIGGGGPLESYKFVGTIVAWTHSVRSPCTGAVLSQNLLKSPGDMATNDKGQTLVCNGKEIDLVGGAPWKIRRRYQSGFKHVVQLRFNSANTKMYVTDGGLNEVLILAYPSGKILHTLRFTKVYAAVDGDNYNP